MANASSSFKDEDASNRWSIYCCSSLGVGVVALAREKSQGLGEAGEPASSCTGCTECLLP